MVPRFCRSRSAPTRRRRPARSASPSGPPASTSPTPWPASASTPTPRRPPCVLGYEVAGEVESVGEGVTDWKLGDRVIAGTRFGGQAELVTVPAEQALPLPDRLSFEQGAAFPVNYGTAYAALILMGEPARGRPRPDPRRRRAVSASPPPRSPATSAPRSSAPPRPPSTTRSARRASPTRSTTAAQDFEAEVMRITGGEGVDLVIDALGPTSFRKDYRLLRSGGRLVMYGLSETSNERRPQHPGDPEEPGEDAAGDDAVVEEPDADEREQRCLRPQHARAGGTARATSTG